MGIFQARIGPPAPGVSFSGKTVIVTGASSGLGLEACYQLAKLKASRIILACRSTAKGERQRAALLADPLVRENGTILDVFELDLDDYQSVLNFTRRVKNELQELDILLNNAGMNILGYHSSKSAHERMMQVNAYSQFLLAVELLPLLRRTAAARKTPTHLSFTSSVHYERHSLSKHPLEAGETIFARFDNHQKFSNISRYPDTKLAVVAFVRVLASKIPPSEVIINEFCPGFVQTNLDHELPSLMRRLGVGARKLVARKVQEGARTLVYAGGIAGPETHGKHLKDNKPQIKSIPFFEQPEGDAFCRKLWEECIEEFRLLDDALPATGI